MRDTYIFKLKNIGAEVASEPTEKMAITPLQGAKPPVV